MSDVVYVVTCDGRVCAIFDTKSDAKYYANIRNDESEHSGCEAYQVETWCLNPPLI